MAFFLQDFPLVATLQNFIKWTLRVSLPNVLAKRALRALWEPRFAAKCCAMFAL